MRSLICSLTLAVALTCVGCAFGEWATRPQGPDGNIPAVKAVTDTISNGLSGFESGGVVAGILALVLTAGKSASRLYSDYQASKPAKARSPQT